VFVYALAPEERMIYVFRTSNLLNTPVATMCSLETKLPLLETELLRKNSTELSMRL